MTDDRMALQSLVEKTSDAELLREMVGFAAQRLMDLEVEALTGASYGERSPDRLRALTVASAAKSRHQVRSRPGLTHPQGRLVHTRCGSERSARCSRPRPCH